MACDALRMHTARPSVDSAAGERRGELSQRAIHTSSGHVVTRKAVTTRDSRRFSRVVTRITGNECDHTNDAVYEMAEFQAF